MARWEPDAAGRLRSAAVQLFVERGYDQTTVADIADRAGLTSRTFFRYFADKREVLFAGSADLQDQMCAAVSDAPADASPMDAIAATLVVSADLLGGQREWSRQRQQVIADHAELRERELIKLDTLGAALAQALRDRGVAEPEASLAADAGIVVFRQAFARWAFADSDADLATVMTDLFAQFRAIAAAH